MIGLAGIDLWGGLTDIADNVSALRVAVILLIVSHIGLVVILVGLVAFVKGFLGELRESFPDDEEGS